MTKNLQLPLVNTVTQEIRQNFKGKAGDSAQHTKAKVERSVQNVVKTFSKLKVDANTHEITGADKDTIANATLWGDRVARPFELGIKYGATAANAWDFAFSFLVGRGVKGDEKATDVSKASGNQAAIKANNWTALRQEGALGMLTRVPAGALGSLVGKCFKDADKGQAAKESIKDATVGFNAAIRAATLTTSASAFMFAGVLVGTGVSALASLVAIPALMRTKVGDAAKPAADSDAAASAKQTAPKVGTPKKLAKTHVSNVAVEDHEVSPAAWKELGRLHGEAESALRTLQASSGSPADKITVKLEKLVASAKAKLDDVKASAAPEPGAVTKASATFDAAVTDFKMHQEKLGKAKEAGIALEAASKAAGTAYVEAKTLNKPEQERATLKTWNTALKTLSAHKKMYDVDPSAQKATKGDLKKASAALASFQEAVISISGKAGQHILEGKAALPEMATMQTRYRGIAHELTRLHSQGIVPSAELPRDGAYKAQLARSLKETTGNLKRADESLSQAITPHAANQAMLQTLHNDKARYQQEAMQHMAKLGTLQNDPEAQKITKQAADRAIDKATDVGVAIHALQEQVAIPASTLDAAVAAHATAGKHLATLLGNAALHQAPISDNLKALQAGYEAIGQTLRDLAP